MASTQVHVPPFWDDALRSEYDRWWRPEELSRQQLYPRPINRYAFKGRKSWFHHQQYLYPAPAIEPRVRPIVSGVPQPPPPKRQKKGNPPSSSRSSTGKSKKVTPADSVLRMRQLRFYPIAAQRTVLKTWFAADRHTYNWALGVLKRQFLRGRRVISLHKFSLKPTFVTCHPSRVPRSLRWMKETPTSVREQAVFELAAAYEAAFSTFHHTPRKPFPTIKFRSKKAGEAAITIPTANFSKTTGRRWDFYIKTFPGKLKFKRRDITRIIDHHPDGPIRQVKLTVTRTGKFYMHVPIYVPKTRVKAENLGHLVTQDPGAKPFMNYYEGIHASKLCVID
ncbi:hypothetical protein DFS34DRAFT_502721 [Phlyctochytrium arcticum]|nr:hypothetical protein DFS34DRAFT_502721 [Phlyctochytrium arcticum]